MEIRYITKDDNPLEISKIYESSWKYAYKNIGVSLKMGRYIISPS